MINEDLRKLFAVIVGLTMLPMVCVADGAAFAMIFPLIGSMVMAYSFIFIILIEAVIVRKIINKIQSSGSYGLKQVLKYSIVANLATTLIGIPVCYAISISLYLYTIDFIYTPPIFLIVFILIPTISFIFEFFMSAYIETKIAYRFFKNVRKEYLRKAIWIANIVSYLLLIFFTIAWTLSNVFSLS